MEPRMTPLFRHPEVLAAMRPIGICGYAWREPRRATARELVAVHPSRLALVMVRKLAVLRGSALRASHLRMTASPRTARAPQDDGLKFEKYAGGENGTAAAQTFRL